MDLNNLRLYKESIQLSKPTMFFIGVSTHKSFVNRVFYEWINLLNLDVELIGVNININNETGEYLKVIEFIKRNPLCLGALVTTHKVNVYKNAKHLFDDLSDHCYEFREIGCIYKKGGLLCGEVTDLFSVRKSLNSFLPDNYFDNNLSDFCILGIGGAGLALAYTVLTSKNGIPNNIYLTDINHSRLKVVESILKKYDFNNNIRFFSVQDKQVDALISQLNPGSIIVNATGLGKDKEGSPFSKKTRIPKNSYLWEFNYRGNLDFMKIAKNQADIKNLEVIDGWEYFINGWIEVMSRIFDIEDLSSYYDNFISIANSKR